MPFKQRDKYFTELMLPGLGRRLRRTCLHTTRKTDAVALERALREVDRRATFETTDYFRLIEAVEGQGRGQSGRLRAHALLVALREEGGLVRLLRRLDDPPALDVLREYLASAPGITREDRTSALQTLPRYLEGVRLSVFQEGAFLQELLEKIEEGEGKRRNSVRRYEMRTLSKMLAWKYGKPERDRIFAGVKFEARSDRRLLRERVVTDQAIARLMEELSRGYHHAGDEFAPVYFDIAIKTGATIRPLSETRAEDFRRLSLSSTHSVGPAHPSQLSRRSWGREAARSLSISCTRRSTAFSATRTR